jgi:hypothetical protein
MSLIWAPASWVCIEAPGRTRPGRILTPLTCAGSGLSVLISIGIIDEDIAI